MNTRAETFGWSEVTPGQDAPSSTCHITSLIHILRHCGGMFESFNAETEAAFLDSQAQHNIPYVRVFAGLRSVVLSERGYLLHRQNRRIATLQLRVCRRLYGAAMRIQRPGRFIFAVKATRNVGDGEHSVRGYDSCIPRCYCVCVSVYSLSEKTETEPSYQLCRWW